MPYPWGYSTRVAPQACVHERDTEPSHRVTGGYACVWREVFGGCFSHVTGRCAPCRTRGRYAVRRTEIFADNLQSAEGLLL
jgi:hypothetical protein